MNERLFVADLELNCRVYRAKKYTCVSILLSRDLFLSFLRDYVEKNFQ